MSKKVKRWEFNHFLMKVKLDEDDVFPFLGNYFDYEKDDKFRTLYGYFAFLKSELESYRNVIIVGEIDFQTFLTRQYSLIKEPEVEESKLDKLDNHLRENFVEEQKISIKDLLELIQEFQEE